MPLVTLGDIVQREIRSQLTAVGTVAPYRTSIVGSEIEGVVKLSPVKEGDFVVAGKTVIAQLNRTDLELGVPVIIAEMEKARQEHLRLQRGSREEEIEAHRARLAEREARLKRDDLDLKRTEDLFKRQIIDRATYERAVSNYESSKNQVGEAQNLLRMAEIGPRQEEIARAKAEVDRIQGLIAQTRDLLSKTVIRAPLTGFVTEKAVEVGQWVQKGGRVAEVIEIGRVIVRVPISENHVEKIRVGDSVRIVLDALGGKSFTGKIRAVIPKADPKSRTFPVEAELANTPDHAIKAGMFARLTMEYGDAVRALLVPKDAIQLRARRTSVFVFEGGKVREVDFTPGRSVDSFVEVTGGALRPGMRLVVQGNEGLMDGMEVRPRASQGRPPAPSASQGSRG
ncbi:MAG: efflux RND transporter periplasmic adaptor subunit [Candidatus Tectomicrobia bacterium]|uniref:Efflux RND transporter periplasmic adaptor subunit n=1 Tax=Tectimicrobiota bacterium TaxID=2528274 RepID=A0A932ZU45_UNCTE|nr:efflux RND transporter periplasmic adaptor subunit [Candidatus Tectomicrobia bacterium]